MDNLTIQERIDNRDKNNPINSNNPREDPNGSEGLQNGTPISINTKTIELLRQCFILI